MRQKLCTLIVLALLAIAAWTGSIVLTQKINVGAAKIAAGQKQIDDGQAMLAQGQARLQNGKERLARAKGVYREVKSIPFMGIADKLPISSDLFNIAKSKIDEGNNLIAKGNEKVRNGESQLAAGKVDLQQGRERLAKMNKIRIACEISALVITLLLIALGYLWRRSW